jgi:hypothetical protein
MCHAVSVKREEEKSAANFLNVSVSCIFYSSEKSVFRLRESKWAPERVKGSEDAFVCLPTTTFFVLLAFVLFCKSKNLEPSLNDVPQHNLNKKHKSESQWAQSQQTIKRKKTKKKRERERGTIHFIFVRLDNWQKVREQKKKVYLLPFIFLRIFAKTNLTANRWVHSQDHFLKGFLDMVIMSKCKSRVMKPEQSTI